MNICLKPVPVIQIEGSVKIAAAENFTSPPPPKKKSCRGLDRAKTKKPCTGSGRENQAEKETPSPHHFSNGPSLTRVVSPIDCGWLPG